MDVTEPLRMLQLVWRAVEELVWPVQCAGCNRWDELLCDDCSRLVFTKPRTLILDDAAGLPSWDLLALGSYEGALREVIVRAKHDRGRDLEGFLFHAGLTLGASVHEHLHQVLQPKDAAVAGSSAHTTLNLREAWVIPAPSSHKRRREHAEVVPHIAQGVVQGLSTAAERRGHPVGVRYAPVVVLNSRRGGQSGLSARGRAARRSGSMKLKRSIPPGVIAVVVDDVVATGATLREVLRLVGPAALVATVIAAA